MFPQLVDQHVLVDVGLVQIGLKLVVQRLKLLAVLDHRVDRIVLELLGRLQLGSVLGQDANSLLAVLVIVIGAIHGAAHETQDDDQNINLEH